MTILGADISNYQGDARLAGAGLGLVLAKVSECTGFVDPWFSSSMAKAAALGLPRGGYHFLRSGNGAAQCDFFLRLLGDPAGKLCALDVEVAGAGSAVPGFLDRFAQKAPGHKLLIYSNRGLWSASGGPDLSRWSSFLAGWHAGYIDGAYSPASGSLGAIWATTAGRVRTSPFGGLSKFPLIQYTDRAQVPGIGNAIDGNAWLGTLAELLALTGATTPTPAPLLEDDMYLGQSPDGTVAIIDGQGKRPLSGPPEIHAYQDLGLVVKEISQAAMNALPIAPTVPTVPAVAAAVLAELPAWVRSATPPPATVDAGALATAVVAGLPAAPAGTLTAADVETAAEAAVRAVLHNA